MSTGTEPRIRTRRPRRGAATRGRTRVAPAAMLGLLAVLAAPAVAPASAHDSLSSSDPAAGATVTAPLETVSLTFSDDLLVLGDEANGFAIQVTAPDGTHLADGCVAVAGTVASTSVALPADGEYAVQWQVVSSDGHPISGDYSFSSATGETRAVMAVTEPPACGDPWAGSEPEPRMTTMTEEPTESPAPAQSTPAASGDDAGTGEDGGAGTADSTSDDTDIPLGVVVIGSLGILAAGALVILVARRRSRDLP